MCRAKETASDYPLPEPSATDAAIIFEALEKNETNPENKIAYHKKARHHYFFSPSDPKNAEARVHWEEARRLEGEWNKDKDTIDSYERSTTDSSLSQDELVFTHYTLAKVYEKWGFYDKAIANLEDAKYYLPFEAPCTPIRGRTLADKVVFSLGDVYDKKATEAFEHGRKPDGKEWMRLAIQEYAKIPASYPCSVLRDDAADRIKTLKNQLRYMD